MPFDNPMVAVRHESVPLHLIDADPGQVRRDLGDLSGLAASIRESGVLQPIALRPGEGNRFLVILGHRRTAAAAAAELTEIRATIYEGLTPAQITAMQAAENMVRKDMNPVEQWRAILRLKEEGMTDAMAAGVLGLDGRTLRRRQLMATIHPTILAIMERGWLPSYEQQRTIALAPAEVQAAAVKKHRLTPESEVQYWNTITHDMVVREVSKAKVIFDDAYAEAFDIRWVEDLFAQGDDAARFTTRQITEVRQATTAWAKEVIGASLTKRKVAWSIAELDQYGQAKTPPGCDGEDWSTTRKLDKAKPDTWPKAPHYTFAISSDGELRVQAWTKKKAPTKKELAAAEQRKTEAKASAPPPAPVTKDGEKLVEEAKRLAVVESIRTVDDPWVMVSMLALALHQHLGWRVPPLRGICRQSGELRCDSDGTDTETLRGPAMTAGREVLAYAILESTAKLELDRVQRIGAGLGATARLEPSIENLSVLKKPELEKVAGRLGIGLHKTQAQTRAAINKRLPPFVLTAHALPVLGWDVKPLRASAQEDEDLPSDEDDDANGHHSEPEED